MFSAVFLMSDSQRSGGKKAQITNHYHVSKYCHRVSYTKSLREFFLLSECIERINLVDTLDFNV